MDNTYAGNPCNRNPTVEWIRSKKNHEWAPFFLNVVFNWGDRTEVYSAVHIYIYIYDHIYIYYSVDSLIIYIYILYTTVCGI